MATPTYFSSSLFYFATILLSVCAFYSASYAVPCDTPTRTARSQAIVRREADSTSPQTQSVIQVKLGLAVMQRFVAINLERLPEELYGGQDTELHERGLRGFTMLFQYVQLFNALERMGFNTTDLTLFRLLTEQILTDACNWITSYNSSTIDCSNPAEFITLLVTLGLNTHVDQLDCYLETTQNTNLEPRLNQVWVNKTIVGEYEQLRCPFCSELNLKGCCAMI